METFDSVLSWIYFVILCVISFISLAANGIVLTWKPSNPDDRLHFSRLGHILRSQALANLTTAIMVIPLWLFILIMEYKNHTSINLDEIDAICFYSFDVLHQLLAALHLVVLATERLCAICWPILHRTASDRVNYIASISFWLTASSISSIVIVVYYFTKTPVLAPVISIGCFGLPCLVIFIIFLVVTVRLLEKILTPSNEIDVTITKEIAVVFLFYLIVSVPYHTTNLLRFFCSSCDLNKFSLSLGLRCLLYSSSAVIPVVLISLVPELRARVQWFCFRFHAINEESRNDLFTMEIPGIQSKNYSCTLVRTALKEEVFIPVQNDILV